ncbi:MAG TPA: hypothetical protein VFJ58_04945 [Armatimonadota bacterium]|nr:hypothetical protein [Armatimonadota bacterium]
MRSPNPTMQARFSLSEEALMSNLVTALSNLSEDIEALRKELAAVASDLRSVTEQNRRQDEAIWSRDGRSHFEELQAQIQGQSLQIKGIWAVLAGLLTFITSWSIWHLK